MKRLFLLLFVPTMALAQPVDEEALIRQVFQTLQPRSINENVEYCGYVGFNKAGALIASPATRGDESSCESEISDDIEVSTASYHTHGAFQTEYFNEIPSGDDMEADEAEGIDGWVATPGGRLWFIDTTDMITFQVCGLDCLPSDPNFVVGDMGEIEESYSYDDLIAVFEE